ncbi:MAG: hypothetical protein ABIG61_16575 [Planctomycetota bacterium]
MKVYSVLLVVVLSVVFLFTASSRAEVYAEVSSNCAGGYRWAADIDDDCRVQFDDYSLLAGNWGSSVGGPQVLTPYATGAAIRIEAEDCIISSAGPSTYLWDGNTVDGNDSYWSSYTVGPDTKVIVATDPCGDNFMATGAIKFVFPDAIPDGTYWLRMKWGLNSWSHYWVSYKIENLGSGYIVESGGSTKANGSHLIWTKYGESEPLIEGEWEGTDELAGPNGFSFYANPDSTEATAVVISNAGAGDLAVTIWDYSIGGYDRVEVDWFELVPIAGETYVIQAEDCIGSGMCDVNTFKEFEYYGTSGHAVIARDANGHFTQTGVGAMAFPFAIPDGEYLLRMNWAVDSWSGYYGKVAIQNLGSGSIIENGGVADSNGWHLFYTRDANETYVDPNIFFGWMNDDIAGPNGMFFDDMGNTIAGSLSVSGVGPGELAVAMDEPSPNGYDVFRIDSFELIPIVPQPGSAAILVQAEDCNLSGLAAIGSLGGIDYVNIASDINEPDPTAYATGQGYMTIPVAIPDGNYILEMRYQANNWAETQSSAYQIFTTGSGSVVENGISTQNGWHSWIIDGTGGGSTAWYVDQIAGPGSSDGTMSESGFSFVTTEPAAEYLTIKGVGAYELVVGIDDYSTAMYNRLQIDYFRLLPYAEPVADLDGDGMIDVNDLAIFVDQWLYCNDPCDANCTDIVCEDKSAFGISEYVAYIPDGAVVIDGNLADWPAFDYDDEYWCTAKWIAMDKLYTVQNEARYFEGAWMCLMYDAASDVVYGAAFAEDYDPWYGWIAWDKQDSMELYIRGSDTAEDPYNPFYVWNIGQQFMIGLDSDETTTYAFWPDETSFATVDPNLEVVVRRIVDPLDSWHHTIIYEFKAIPYINFGGFDSSTTTTADLSSGYKFGLDMIIANYSYDIDEAFSMHCPNLQTGKAYDVNKYAIVTCE